MTDLNPEQVREWRKRVDEWPADTEARRIILALCDSWLAQREALAAARAVVTRWREVKSCSDEIALLDVALASLSSPTEDAQ